MVDDTPGTAPAQDGTPAMARLFSDARARHGAFHLRRCDEHGLSRVTVSNRARREAWERPYPQVLYLPGSVDGWLRTSAGRLELVGPDAALGGRSAAYAHGLLWPAPTVTRILREHGRHRTSRPDIVVRCSRTLEPGDIAVVDGLRCTAPLRTMSDLAATTEATELRAFGIDGLTKGLFTVEGLARVAERLLPGDARDRLLRTVEALAGTRTESPFAYEVIEAMADRGLDVVGEFPWRCPDGRVIHLDAAVPAAWVQVECDGRGKYATGRSFTTDRIRWTQTSGQWQTVWIDWHRWRHSPQAVLDDIVRAVALADPMRSPAQPADCRCARCARWRCARGETATR